MTRISQIQPARLLLYSLVPLTLGGCRSDAGQPATVAVRDSAGIRIVENTAPRWSEGQGWRLSESPILEIGVLEGDPEYQLYRVAAAVRLGDGRIVLANNGTSELRFYDSTGAHLRSAGREGEGPGEFRGLWHTQEFSGDSLLTYDFRNRRISIFTPTGEFARSFTPEPLAGAVAFPNHVAAFADGTILLGLESPSSAEGVRSGVNRRPIAYVRCESTGALIDTIGEFPGTEWYTETEEDGTAMRIMMAPRAFGRIPQTAVTGDGVYFGSGDSYEIRHYHLDGSLQRIIRLEQPSLPVTAEDIARYKQENLERARDENERRMAERRLADMPFPETMPPYADLVVDSEGNLWVEEYRRPGEEQARWQVFDPDGELLGAIETPPRFNVFEIGGDFVLGRWVDELDVEHVRLYEIIKPSVST